jgi:hypothetical protein
MKLSLYVAMPPIPRAWTRLVWVLVVVLLARLSGVPSQALPLIVGSSIAAIVPARRRSLAGGN